MLIKVAWRNIWRHKVRSFVVITAIALGLWAGVFASAFVNGMMQGKVNGVIELEMSHIQLHAKNFRDEYLPNQTIQNSSDVIDGIWAQGSGQRAQEGLPASGRRQADKESNTNPQSLNPDPATNEKVKAVSGRIVAMAMLASPNKSGAAKIMGVDPSAEASLSVINEKIIEGSFFENAKRNPIVISKKLAEEYKVGLRSKLVVTFQDIDNEIVAGAFRINGIFDTGNGMYDELHVFVRKNDINELMGVGEDVHEIAVLLNEHDAADPMAEKFSAMYPDLEVLAWPDLSSGMRYMIDAFDTYLYFLVGIVLLALLFSIVNTMLMAVLERVREIGMLMAVGMTKTKVFTMIMIETVFLSMIGGPIGLLFSWASISFWGTRGINLASAAYGEMGFANVIYPFLETKSYWDVTWMVLLMAVVAAIYPAIKALSLKPVEAIRKI